MGGRHSFKIRFGPGMVNKKLHKFRNASAVPSSPAMWAAYSSITVLLHAQGPHAGHARLGSLVGCPVILPPGRGLSLSPGGDLHHWMRSDPIGSFISSFAGFGPMTMFLHSWCGTDITPTVNIRETWGVNGRPAAFGDKSVHPSGFKRFMSWYPYSPGSATNTNTRI
jgi:hypothetical protein